MKTLTLEQVMREGRFAVLFTGDDSIVVVYAPGVGIVRLRPFDAEDSERVAEDQDLFTIAGAPVPLSGEYAEWHHLPDCDCEFCNG